MQLICLFTTEPDIDHTVLLVSKTYEVIYKRIFILSIEESEELVCSFNVEKGNIRKQLPGAMLVHRKKETNTLYTINSLNALIRKDNNGIVDANFSVDWTQYSNSLLVTSNNELKVLKTKIFQIINL